MIVMQSRTPVINWPSASHQPNSTIQMMLAIALPPPATADLTTVRPKGQMT